MAGRPPTSMRNRPPTNQRPGSSMRMGTGRPGTRSGQAGGGNSVFGSGIKVEDRPMTQHGLAAMKTGSRGPQRQIQDRSYFLGEIRSRTTELTSEIRKIETEIYQRQEENNTFLMFEKRAESLATEIANIQGELHDYNMMIDRINQNQELADMVDDLNAFKVKNDRDAESIERIFEQTAGKEREIQEMEKEILRQKTLTENRVQDMEPGMRKKYSRLKQEGMESIGALERLQEELERLSTKQHGLEMEMSNDAIKQEAVKMYETLHELNQKKESLEQEERARVSPEQEQQQLLSDVKMHNQDISALDRQTKELEENINRLQEELHDAESALEDQQSENTAKFRELQGRGGIVDSFMGTYDDVSSGELQQADQLQESIVVLLEQISKSLTTSANLPTRDELKALKDDLQFKEGELQKAETTSHSLQSESSRLQDDLTKVEGLEERIQGEKASLIEKTEEMLKELETYKDISSLQQKASERKEQLEQDKIELQRKKNSLKDKIQRMNTEYHQIEQALSENETNAQLSNLERRWQHLETSNFNMKEYIAVNSNDSQQKKDEVMKDLEATNKLLQEICTKSSLIN